MAKRTGDGKKARGQRHASAGGGKGGGQSREAQVEQALSEPDHGCQNRFRLGSQATTKVFDGNLVQSNKALTTVSQLNPLKAYFQLRNRSSTSIRRQMNHRDAKRFPRRPAVDLIWRMAPSIRIRGGLLTNRQVDVATGSGSIQVFALFRIPKTHLAPVSSEDCGGGARSTDRRGFL